MALPPFFGGVQRPGFLLVILTHILIIHTKSPKEIITNFSQLFYFATSKHTGVKIHFLLLKPRILFKIYLTFWPKNSCKIYWKVFNFCPSVCYSETEIRFCWLFFNEELQKKILKLLSSRHVIFCLTMCNRKQDLVLFFSRVVIPHFMRRQLLCEKITISGGQVYIWLQSRYSPAQNYFFIKSVLM